MIGFVVFVGMLGIGLALLWLLIEGSEAYDEGRADARAYSPHYYNRHSGVGSWLYNRGFDWKDKTADIATKNAQRRIAKTGNKEKI